MGFFDKIKSGLSKTTKNLGGMFLSFTGANDEFFDELEEKLILADVGADTASDAVERLREAARQNAYRGADEVRSALADILIERVSGAESALNLRTSPSVVLMIGVNGVGKTTTLGKLAKAFTADGKKVLLVAGDTFRAAAAEQLGIWAERAGADLIRHAEGADPASVIFDGIAAAKARGADVVLCDTAGRLHNKSNLMNELNKISRIIDRELPGADRETLLVLDATTGQNGLIQARQFQESAGITGIVLTKLDGTAKGGIVVAIASQLGLPVKYIGVGEGADDLIPFDAREFVEALLE
ncbi:MAG: signal recognition particle-docking protein FtsY [Oscillospiraceae bacterium]|jgi:fused signal recognition particle receptor|nr:signal recognition particle-docking protein FtsY [Oscillospiraceae bacterium]